jgi:hypothetical protein
MRIIILKWPKSHHLSLPRMQNLSFYIKLSSLNYEKNTDWVISKPYWLFQDNLNFCKVTAKNRHLEDNFTQYSRILNSYTSLALAFLSTYFG